MRSHSPFDAGSHHSILKDPALMVVAAAMTLEATISRIAAQRIAGERVNYNDESTNLLSEIAQV